MILYYKFPIPISIACCFVTFYCCDKAPRQWHQVDGRVYLFYGSREIRVHPGMEGPGMAVSTGS